MNTITIFLSNGEVLRLKQPGTIPHLQRKFAIGTATATDEGKRCTIEALTVES